MYKNRTAFFTNKIYRPVAFCTLNYFFFKSFNKHQVFSVTPLTHKLFFIISIIIIDFVKFWMLF